MLLQVWRRVQSGLLSNYDAYQRWVRAAHERVQFVKGALAMVDMLVDDSDAKKHRDLRRTGMERKILPR
jgi:hypothetical protein